MRRAVATYPRMTTPHALPLLDLAAVAALTARAGVSVLDFTAPWCGPCKAMAPVLVALADEYRGRAQLAEVDVEREPAVAERFGVRSMPTLVLLRDGREVGRVVGTRPRAFLAGMIDRALAGDYAITCP